MWQVELWIKPNYFRKEPGYWLRCGKQPIEDWTKAVEVAQLLSIGFGATRIWDLVADESVLSLVNGLPPHRKES